MVKLLCFITHINSSTQTRMKEQEVRFPSENPAGEGQGVLFDNPQHHDRLLIFLHEMWGMTDNVKHTAAWLSKEGDFPVLIIDLYRGEVANNDESVAAHLRAQLAQEEWQPAIQDIKGAVTYINETLHCTNIAILGLCMGGALAFAAAAEVAGLCAAFPFYGIPPQSLFDLTKINIPVQAHFAAQDHVIGFSSPQDYLPLVARLKAAGVDITLFEYDGPHGFANYGTPNYKENLAKIAYTRVIDYMQNQLTD